MGMNKKTLTVAARTIFILAVLIWVGLVIEFALNVDSEETAFGKQLFLSFGGIVIEIVVISSFKGKDI